MMEAYHQSKNTGKNKTVIGLDKSSHVADKLMMEAISSVKKQGKNYLMWFTN